MNDDDLPSNVIAFPSNRSAPNRASSPYKTPDIKISHELTELASLNRRLIALTDYLGQRILEQERRLQAMERRLILLGQEVFRKEDDC